MILRASAEVVAALNRLRETVQELVLRVEAMEVVIKSLDDRYSWHGIGPGNPLDER